MAGIQSVLDIGQWALHAQQLGMAVTAHNVANVNTPGYSRQRLILEPATPENYQPGQIGRGVRAASIERVYDKFLGIQLRNELSAQGSLRTQSSYYKQLESIYSGLSDSDLGSELRAFWSAWDDLSLHPEGITERVGVREAALQVASRITGLRDKLAGLREQLNRSVRVSLDRVNELTSHVAELNLQIKRSEGSGQNANDLRDMRDKAMDELAGLMEIQFWETGDGVSVVGPGGTALVEGPNHWVLTSQTSDTGLENVFWKSSSGALVSMTDKIGSGSIGGMLRLGRDVVSRELERLEGLSRELIWNVNQRLSTSSGREPFSSLTGQVVSDPSQPLNASGLPFADRIQDGEIHIWLYDEENPPSAVGRIQVSVVAGSTTVEDLADQIQNHPDNNGRLLATVSAEGRLMLEGVGGVRFAISQDTSGALAALGVNGLFTGSGSQDIAVSVAVMQDARLIGAGRVDDTTGAFAPGDNRAALDVLALRDTPVMDGESLEKAWSTAVAGLGVEASGAYRIADYQDQVVDQLEQQRSSTSGVNLDEEMVKLLEYQWAYQAAARLIETGRDMMKSLIEMMR
jgi:flagellar hook-associated protein 1 FlgK